MAVFRWWTDLAKVWACFPRRFISNSLLLILLVGALGGESVALAVPEDACIKDEKCKEHYTKAVKLYKDEYFDEALTEFQAAYESRQMPLLLVNIGRTLQKLGRPKDALGYYERFLQAESKIDPETKKRVDDYIVQVKALIGENDKPEKVVEEKRPVPATPPPPPPPSSPPTPPPPPPGRNLLIAGAVITAVGIGGLIASIALGASAQVQANTFSSSIDEFDKLSAKSSAQSLNNGAIAAGILGTAVGATGAVLMVVGIRQNRTPRPSETQTVAPATASPGVSPGSPPQAMLVPWASSTGAGLVLQGGF